MEAAIRQAKIARKQGDYAIGAVVVRNGKIISQAGSRSKRDESPIAHAETLAILQASRRLGKRHIPDCILYTTHEPCPMCASLAVWAKIKGVVYGSQIADMREHRQKKGNDEYQWRTIDIPCREVVRQSTEKIAVIGNFRREECKKLFHS